MVSKYQGNLDHKFLNLPNVTLGTYNLWDSYETAKLVAPLVTRLERNQQWDYYMTWVQPLQRAVIVMQHVGLPVNTKAKASLKRKMSVELAQCDKFIRSVATEHAFSYTDKFPNSKDQVAKLLFIHLGLKAGRRTEKGRPSVDQPALLSVLRKLLKRDEHLRGLLENLLHRSRLNTIKTRYLNFEVDDDRRVRPLVKMFATKTWRFAYEEPPLHQYPEEARHIFEAPEGWRFVTADHQQLEARILAVLSGDQTSLKAFAAGEDIHWSNAKDMLGAEARDDDPKEKRKSTRNLAKIFLYKISYGGSLAAESEQQKVYCPCPKCYDKVPQVLDLKPAELALAERRWYARHPQVTHFHNRIEAEIKRLHYYQSPLGPRRYISKPWGPELSREAKNLPMQFNAALIMGQEQVRLHRRGVPICLQWHDSFTVLCKTDRVGHWAHILKQEMETPTMNTTFPIDISSGKNLGTFSDTNPDGMAPWTGP